MAYWPRHFKFWRTTSSSLCQYCTTYRYICVSIFNIAQSADILRLLSFWLPFFQTVQTLSLYKYCVWPKYKKICFTQRTYKDLVVLFLQYLFFYHFLFWRSQYRVLVVDSGITGKLHHCQYGVLELTVYVNLQTSNICLQVHWQEHVWWTETCIYVRNID